MRLGPPASPALTAHHSPRRRVSAPSVCRALGGHRDIGDTVPAMRALEAEREGSKAPKRRGGRVPLLGAAPREEGDTRPAPPAPAETWAPLPLPRVPAGCGARSGFSSSPGPPSAPGASPGALGRSGCGPALGPLGRTNTLQVMKTGFDAGLAHASPPQASTQSEAEGTPGACGHVPSPSWAPVQKRGHDMPHPETPAPSVGCSWSIGFPLYKLEGEV